MATILEFRHPDAGRDRLHEVPVPVKHAASRSAEIIIFPGVRIERTAAEEPAGVALEPGKRAYRVVQRKP